MKGSRVQAVVQELRGEKIDIVPYDRDPARFVCNAIAPAEVARVIIDADSHRWSSIVPDEKLSLAIGRKGQNVRLASQLTGWSIDIHSESKVREMEARARQSLARSAATARGLRTGRLPPRRCSRPAGARRPRWRRGDLKSWRRSPASAASTAAKALIAAAAKAAEGERARMAEEAAHAAKEAAALAEGKRRARARRRTRG